MSEEKEIAKEYLELAKIDLTASHILFEKKIFNVAIFELQQAVEKITKAFCLGVNINNQTLFTLREMKGKGSHDPLKFLIETIERYIDLLSKNKTFDEFSIKVQAGVIQQLNLQKAKIFQITGKEEIEEINIQLNELKQIKDFRISNLPKEQVKVILQGIYKVNLTNEEFDSKYLELKDSLNKNEFLRGLNKIFLPLFLLGALTFKHEQSTRYPYESLDASGNTIFNLKPKEYQASLGVVGSFKNLWKLTELVINNLENELR